MACREGICNVPIGYQVSFKPVTRLLHNLLRSILYSMQLL